MHSNAQANSTSATVRTIAIMGAPISSGNRGVLALGASLLNLCWDAAPGSKLVLLLGNRDKQPASFRVGGKPASIAVVNCRLSPRSSPKDHLFVIFFMSVLYRLFSVIGAQGIIARRIPWIDATAKADFVGNVHGGDSFSDIYGIKGLMLTFTMDWSVILVKGSMVQFPQTYGPYKSYLARAIARFLLRRSSVIIARDKASRQIAQDLIGPENEVLLSPDVAFSLESIVPATLEVSPPATNSPRANLIGLNVNGLMYNGGYTKNNMFGLTLDYPSFLPGLLVALLQEHPGEVWLVPHTFAPEGDVESDQEASRKLRDALPAALQARVRIVTREYDQHEIKGVIRGCDFFIGSRMHSCIAALSQGIPCVGVAYSMKFAGVFESVGMESWVVDGRTVDNERAISRVLELYRQRDTVRAPLKQRADEARSQLRDVFAALVNGTRG